MELRRLYIDTRSEVKARELMFYKTDADAVSSVSHLAELLFFCDQIKDEIKIKVEVSPEIKN